jgi:hypothetical protein
MSTQPLFIQPDDDNESNDVVMNPTFTSAWIELQNGTILYLVHRPDGIRIEHYANDEDIVNENPTFTYKTY